ncbi:hypothetical protein FEM48_Zijuj11G0142000 [Ziziphus jujuba var. spinosa]|uniref:Uncharacterized protein n=1 Tax=Ziziphus jujuba var. spinosa TaxID=714518 RepID=A0A978UJE5_ZIZJJ|nr:hypothetical protein FEM48_Zijuj11G0142000 [Ziziphus jujuba var. spinosa]
MVPNPPIEKADDKKCTPLHEAGAIGNVEAAQVLVHCSSEQLEARNAVGETLMYRAAAFGMTEVVKYLASEVRSHNFDMHIKIIRSHVGVKGPPLNQTLVISYELRLPSNEHHDDKDDQMNLRQCNALESGQGRNHLHLSFSLSFNRASRRPTNWRQRCHSARFPTLDLIAGPRESQQGSSIFYRFGFGPP